MTADRPLKPGTRAQREARRARSVRKFSGADRQGAGECSTGHPPVWNITPAVELGRMPEGGGYPVGFVETAARLMGCTDLASILHVCSGSVRARFTIDARLEARPAVVADVRWLPVRPGSVRWALADPPYGPDYADELWGLGKLYPTPIVLLREVAQALAPGGRVGFLDHVVPSLPPDLKRVGTYGIITGVGYRIRAFTVAEKRAEALTLDL